MKILIGFVLACRLAFPQAAEQSLAEAARKEAERRRQLAEQNVEAKVIRGRGSLEAANGNVTTFGGGTARGSTTSAARESKGRTSLSSYRNQLRKLESEIRDCEERQRLLRRQADAERWTLPKSGRRGVGTGSQTSREKLLMQAQDLQIRIERLRRERQEIWDEARKSGYLPGEVDGKALAP